VQYTFIVENEKPYNVVGYITRVAQGWQSACSRHFPKWPQSILHLNRYSSITNGLNNKVLQTFIVEN